MAENTKMNACAQMEQELVLYYYGELESAGRTRIEAHTEGCEGCRASLKEMQTVLPLTGSTDEPPQAFWTAYTREMRQKLAAIDERQPWWARLGSWSRPWALPAIATTAVIAIAMVFTLGKGLMGPSEVPPADEALMEALPVAEKLDFFTHMELLDSLELLESAGAGNGQV
jgi:anti-sigma factor RsiW